jgi:hypothetical protein
MLVDSEEAKDLFIQNDLEPLISYPGAGVPWKSVHVKCGREVEPTYSNVRAGHSGCKFCVGNIVDEEKARKLFISRGLLPIEPYTNALSTWKSIHQECGKVVTPRYNTVQQGSSGCIHCYGVNTIDEKTAKELFEKNGLEPLEDFPGTSMRWKSRHQSCGRTVFPRYSSIQQGSSGCIFCSKKRVAEEDANQLFAERGLKPIENFVNTQTPWRSIHIKCGREVSPTYTSVKQGSGGCGYCGGNTVDGKEAEKLFVSRGLIPQDEFPGAKIPWRAIHAQCGREVYVRYAYVLDGSSGCRECSANYVNPELALEVFRSADLEPLEPYPGASRGWRSIHTVCGREVSPHWGYVRKYLAGCKYCAGKALTELDAIQILKEKNFTPLEPYPGANKPWNVIHEVCGKKVRPRLNSLQFAIGSGAGCSSCADSTFNYADPALIYLMTNEALAAHKIGISGDGKNRVQQHRRHGWETYKTVKVSTGEIAYNIEQEILNWLRETYGWKPFLSKEEMPQGGYTETMDGIELNLVSIWEKVEELIRRVSNG